MDGAAWWAAVHGVTTSWTRLSDFTFTFHFHALEKKVATHSSILAWRIPWTEETGGLQSVHEIAKTEQLTCLPPLLSHKNVSLKANRNTIDENNSQTMLGKHVKPSHC